MQYFPPWLFAAFASSVIFAAPSAPKTCFPSSDPENAIRSSIDVTSSFISLIRDSAAARSPDVPTAFRYASPSALSSGQQDGAAIIFSTSALISCFVIIYLLSCSHPDYTTDRSRIHHTKACRKAAGKQPRLQLQYSSHTRGFSKAATPTASAKQPRPQLPSHAVI